MLNVYLGCSRYISVLVLMRVVLHDVKVDENASIQYVKLYKDLYLAYTPRQ